MVIPRHNRPPAHRPYVHMRQMSVERTSSKPPSRLPDGATHAPRQPRCRRAARTGPGGGCRRGRNPDCFAATNLGDRMIPVSHATAPIAFALFWLALVAFFEVRLAERQPMNHIRNAPPSTPTAAHLGTQSHDRRADRASSCWRARWSSRRFRRTVRLFAASSQVIAMPLTRSPRHCARVLP
jgi:hypothetical protein